MESRYAWSPWQEMRRLQHEMEHLLADLTPAARAARAAQFPPLNITRGDEGITLEALCPGVDRASLDVTVVGDAVTIRGERQAEPDVPEQRYHRRERPVGAFTRTIAVGDRLDGDRTEATYASGVLRVQLARAAEATPKKIQIQS